MAAATGGGGGAKAAVAEQIGQAVQSTSNLLQLMEQSSPAQVPHPPLFLSLLSVSTGYEFIADPHPFGCDKNDKFLSNPGNFERKSMLMLPEVVYFRCLPRL
jgi:hypothetical protein